MASVTITVAIDEAFIPGLRAELHLQAQGGNFWDSAEAYVQASANELMRQACERYRVGPYWRPSEPPVFNQDGTLNVPPPEETLPGGGTDELIDPLADEVVDPTAEPLDPPADTTEPTLVRARNEEGEYVGDDPTTPENEAWVAVAEPPIEDSNTTSEGPIE
jgi:hypothetical protein